jgi:MinD superfamily P-loop ATPase
MERSLNNFHYLSETRFGTLVHAKMGPGEENSGKLVTEIRRKAKETAKKQNADFIINDGPPGIGCSAISSITGTNKILLVIEPSKSGFHDIKRLIELIDTFKIKKYAVINKFDINMEITTEIEEFLRIQNIPLIGKIPFDKMMVEALINKKAITEFIPDSEISMIFKLIWQKISI